MEKADLKLKECQIAIFQEDFDFELTQLYEKLVRELPDYDIKPELLPFESLPKNIVRIFIYNKNKDFEIRVSPEKISYYWYTKQFNTGLSLSIEQIAPLILSTYSKIVDTVKINRLGVINTYALDKSKEENLINTFLIEKYHDNLREFNARLTFDEDLNNTPHNQLYSLDTNAIFNATKDRIVSIQSDLNSHQDQKLGYSIEQAVELIKLQYKTNNLERVYKLFFA